MIAARRYVLALGALAAAMLLWLGSVAALLWASLSSAERDALPVFTGDRAAAVVVASLAALALAAAGLRRLHREYVEAPVRLFEQTRAAVAGDVDREIEAAGSPETRAMTRACWL